MIRVNKSGSPRFDFSGLSSPPYKVVCGCAINNRSCFGRVVVANIVSFGIVGRKIPDKKQLGNKW